MIAINSELVKRLENGDVIVRGAVDEIERGIFEDDWRVTENLRESEEIRVQKSGLVNNLSSTSILNQKLPYAEFVDNNWYIL